jgi:hypothetical protein
MDGELSSQRDWLFPALRSISFSQIGFQIAGIVQAVGLLVPERAFSLEGKARPGHGHSDATGCPSHGDEPRCFALPWSGITMPRSGALQTTGAHVPEIGDLTGQIKESIMP